MSGPLYQLGQWVTYERHLVRRARISPGEEFLGRGLAYFGPGAPKHPRVWVPRNRQLEVGIVTARRTLRNGYVEYLDGQSVFTPVETLTAYQVVHDIARKPRWVLPEDLTAVAT